MMMIFKNLFRKGKSFLRALFNSAQKRTIDAIAPLLAPAISYMARTGIGTDACLKEQCLPLLVNFHSPIPDLADLKERHIWEQRSALSGIDFRPDAQVRFLRELGNTFGNECHWPQTPSDDPYQFYTENCSFSYGCAVSTHCMIRHFKPDRLIEIGSGNSSLVIASAIRMNKQISQEKEAQYTIIDPYPRKIIAQNFSGCTHLIKQRVELLDGEIFTQLGENDVLFIDSGHAVRIGSDVNFLILDVLPRLASGVIIHFHDIALPYEYAKIYATNPAFRMFWTEAYLLQAFLCLNEQFEILLAMGYLMNDRREEFQAAFPFYNPTKHPAISGSFWIRRK